MSESSKSQARLPALLGGEPIFSERVPIVRPTLPRFEELSDEFAEIINTGMLTKGKHLWSRTIGSTMVGQFVDTIIVMTIIFAGQQSFGVIWKLIYSGYLAKVLYEAAATPLTYLVVNRLKKSEGVDVFDENEDFNPFRT